MSDYAEEEALRRYRNSLAASQEIRTLREQIADILTVGCTNEMASRGFYVTEQQTEKLHDLLTSWL